MTLTQAAILTKRGILLFFVLIFLGVFAKVGYSFWYSRYYLPSKPPVEEKAEMRFGPLPSLQFPSPKVSSSNFSYSLDTTTGNLPQTPKLVKVFFIPQAKISLLSPQKSQELAGRFGFTNGPEQVSSTKQRFMDNEEGYLIVDVPTGNFNFQREFSASPSAGQNLLSDKPRLIGQFKNYLEEKGLLPEELKNGRSEVTEDTVSLWPINIDNLPIVTANFNTGLVETTPRIIDNNIQYSTLNYAFWVIDQTTSSTYPIKSADQALVDLQSGRGFISLDPKVPKVSVTSVYLAYFQSEEYSPYLQPVFVFEGPEFAALVPAITQ